MTTKVVNDEYPQVCIRVSKDADNTNNRVFRAAVVYDGVIYYPDVVSVGNQYELWVNMPRTAGVFSARVIVSGAPSETSEWTEVFREDNFDIYERDPPSLNLAQTPPYDAYEGWDGEQGSDDYDPNEVFNWSDTYHTMAGCLLWVFRKERDLDLLLGGDEEKRRALWSEMYYHWDTFNNRFAGGNFSDPPLTPPQGSDRYPHANAVTKGGFPDWFRLDPSMFDVLRGDGSSDDTFEVRKRAYLGAIEWLTFGNGNELDQTLAFRTLLGIARDFTGRPDLHQDLARPVEETPAHYVSDTDMPPLQASSLREESDSTTPEESTDAAASEDSPDQMDTEESTDAAASEDSPDQMDTDVPSTPVSPVVSIAQPAPTPPAAGGAASTRWLFYDSRGRGSTPVCIWVTSGQIKNLDDSIPVDADTLETRSEAGFTTEVWDYIPQYTDIPNENSLRTPLMRLMVYAVRQDESAFGFLATPPQVDFIVGNLTKHPLATYTITPRGPNVVGSVVDLANILLAYIPDHANTPPTDLLRVWLKVPFASHTYHCFFWATFDQLQTIFDLGHSDEEPGWIDRFLRRVYAGGTGIQREDPPFPPRNQPRTRAGERWMSIQQTLTTSQTDTVLGIRDFICTSDFNARSDSYWNARVIYNTIEQLLKYSAIYEDKANRYSYAYTRQIGTNNPTTSLKSHETRYNLFDALVGIRAALLIFYGCAAYKLSVAGHLPVSGALAWEDTAASILEKQGNSSN